MEEGSIGGQVLLELPFFHTGVQSSLLKVAGWMWGPKTQGKEEAASG